MPAALLALFPFVNHALFRTYALDLGFYTHALFDYRRFQWADNNMIMAVFENHLAGHFDLYLPLFSPLTWAFGSRTLLTVQWLAVLFGGVGIRRFFEPGDWRMALLAQWAFYSFYGIHNALGFDYHSNVVAACLLPWLFLALHKNELKKAAFWGLLIIVAKENMSLWLVFVFTALAWQYRFDLRRRNWSLKAAGIAAVYFILISMWIIPALSQTDEYRGFLYSQLGDSPLETLVYLFQFPGHSFKLLYYADIRDALPDPWKLELHRFILFSGGWLLLFQPKWIWMILPIYAQKLWHDNPYIWGIGGQYSVEFTPILILGAFSVVLKISSARRWVVAVLLMSGLIFISAQNMDETEVFNEKSRIRIFSSEHYRNEVLDVEAVQRLLEQIPEAAAVSAQSPFVPHLALREHCFQFPLIRQSEYLLISPAVGSYPLSWECYEEVINEQLTSGQWKEVGTEGGASLYQRID